MNTKMTLTIILVLAVVAGALWYFNRRTTPPPPKVSEVLITSPVYEIEAGEIQYYNNVNGYFAHPTADDIPSPGVVMIHEWWGLNDNIKDMARQLAGQGYEVIAVDLYNGEVAATPEKARELSAGLQQEEALENLKAAVAFLRERRNVSGVASLGWCFGGAQSLQLALSGTPLDATVIYYGRLTPDKEKLQSIAWPVLGIFGEQDTSIPVADVNAFSSALDELKIENQVYLYPGVGHAFANPSGANYAPEQTRDAWEKTLRFLRDSLPQRER